MKLPSHYETVAMLLLLVFALSARAADSVEAKKPYGIEKRIAWNTSHVVGSPEPPYLFRATQVFTKLKLDKPLYIEHEPGTDHLFVIQQAGKILRFRSQPNVEKAEEVVDVGPDAYGLTFHPQYKKNGYLYVVSNGPKSEKVKKDRVSRFTVDRKSPFHCDPKSERVIIEWVSNGHNGGDLEFGPDGYLYITAGDGTSDSDTNSAGQNVSNLNATLIRIDVDHPDKDRPYSIPKDNPFIGRKPFRPEIWAYGFRNPWRMTFDRKTGHLWIGNVGQDMWEMIHLVKRGDNYGWPVTEGSHPFHFERKPGPTPIVKPTIEHPHSEARSITGGIVYYGSKFPELTGAYIYGDYSTGKLWAAKHDGEQIEWHKEIADTTIPVVGFGTDPQGELLLVDLAGSIFQLERIPPVASRPKFPLKLSETGLFTSVQEHKPHPGLIPYTVNAPLWSDNAQKTRFIGLPGDSRIGFSASRGWDFPDGTVLVKSFALEMIEGQPESRRWIETRLLHKEQGEFTGYSYVWNDEQTDAVLVPKAGVDRVFHIKDSASSDDFREQKWHYPSRAECMMCHTRASKYVLGLSTLQMNKTYDYGSLFDNQLRTFEHLGLFRGPKKKDDNPPGRLPKRPHALPKLVDPHDTTAHLEARVRSYLQANCAICHVAAGGGNSRMLLEFITDREKMNILDQPPQHTKLALTNPRIIAPGNPQQSVMYQRISRRGRYQMPPLGSAMVDKRGVKLLQEWIQQLPMAKSDTSGQ